MNRPGFYIFIALAAFAIGTLFTSLANKPACVIESRVRRISSCNPVNSENFAQKLRNLSNTESKFYAVSCVCPKSESNQNCEMILEDMR